MNVARFNPINVVDINNSRVVVEYSTPKVLGLKAVMAVGCSFFLSSFYC